MKIFRRNREINIFALFPGEIYLGQYFPNWWWRNHRGHIDLIRAKIQARALIRGLQSVPDQIRRELNNNLLMKCFDYRLGDRNHYNIWKFIHLFNYIAMDRFLSKWNIFTLLDNKRIIYSPHSCLLDKYEISFIRLRDEANTSAVGFKLFHRS